MIDISKFVLPLVLAAPLVFMSAPSRADTAPGADKVTAEALDAEGTALLDARRYEEACAKLSESYRLLPGTGVLVRLGLCQELQGKTASAWTTFRAAAARARATGDAQAEMLASKRASALEQKLSHLTISVAPSVASAERVMVTRDGVPLGHGALGAPLPVDPGAHVVEATAPDGRTFTRTVVVADGGRAQTVTVTFDGASGATSEAAKDDANAKTGSWSTQRTLALVAGGVGVAGIVVGSVFGATAMTKNDYVKSRCPTARDCDQDVVDASRARSTAATISTTAFVAGGASLVGGIVLWLMAPPSAPASGARSAPTKVGTSSTHVDSGRQRWTPSTSVHVTSEIGLGQLGIRMEATW